ncbi:uncharacterized protein LOC143280576 [Babylonia areolata]|uniref:uncharacterized protein LOC143280576 n=1 Tax=Babylonia areolata TaxID=304850 RepID=UPI003FD28D8A
MSTKQAVFVRSYKDSLAPSADAVESEGKPMPQRDRAFSFYSAYSFGSKTNTDKQGPVPGPPAVSKKVEDDLETVLDVSEKLMPYDESGKRTYERACKKVGVTPASNCLRNLEMSANLDLQYYGLGPKAIIPVAMALMINNSVTQLNLEGNGLGAEGISYIQKMMEDNNCILDINVAGNQLLSRGADCIASMLTKNKTITHLNLSDNGFVDADATCLAKAIENHPRLSALNISHNNFGDQSAHSFSHMMAENGCLQEVDLSWNHFRGRGAQMLGKGLAENISVKVLNLSWNGVEDEGAMALGKSLTQNGVLQELDISCNRVSPQGFLDLLKALGRNDTLETLRIGKNNISDAGAEMAVDLLKKMHHVNLKLLDLSDVILSNAINPRIEEMQTVHPDLKIVYGYTDSYGKRKLRSYDMVSEAIEIMQTYCQMQGITLVEMFARFDADGSMSVTHAEFREGLKDAKIPLSPLHIDKLIESLDQDGDGEIDFSELVIGTEEKISGSAKSSKSKPSSASVSNATQDTATE